MSAESSAFGSTSSLHLQLRQGSGARHLLHPVVVLTILDHHKRRKARRIVTKKKKSDGDDSKNQDDSQEEGAAPAKKKVTAAEAARKAAASTDGTASPAMAEKEKEKEEDSGVDVREVVDDFVVGLLLGSVKTREGEVHVCSSVPVMHTVDPETGVASADAQLVRKALNLHATVSPREKVVGWYTTGPPGFTKSTASLHQSFRVGDLGFPPVVLHVDTALTDDRMRLRAFTGSCVVTKDRPSVWTFEDAHLQLHAYEEEKIGVDALIHSETDNNNDALDAPQRLLSAAENIQYAMDDLLQALDNLTKYVDDAAQGRIKGDPVLGRRIMKALAVVPKIEPKTFVDTFSTHLNDMLLLVYLSNLTRTQVALADKIQSTM